MFAPYLAGKELPHHLSQQVPLQLQLPQPRRPLESPRLDRPDHVVVEVQLGEPDVVLERFLRHSRQEVVAQSKFAQLLKRLESIVGNFVENIVLEVQAAELSTPCEGGIAH